VEADVATAAGRAWSSPTSVSVGDLLRTDLHLDFLADPPLVP
jgi:hypothetical protein